MLASDSPTRSLPVRTPTRRTASASIARSASVGESVTKRAGRTESEAADRSGRGASFGREGEGLLPARRLLMLPPRSTNRLTGEASCLLGAPGFTRREVALGAAFPSSSAVGPLADDDDRGDRGDFEGPRAFAPLRCHGPHDRPIAPPAEVSVATGGGCPSRRAGGVRLGGRGSSPSSSRSRWRPAPNPGPSLTGSTAAPTGGDDEAASPVTPPPAVATRARPLGRFRSPYPATLRTFDARGSVTGFDSSVAPATLGCGDRQSGARSRRGSTVPSTSSARGAKVSATWPARHTPRTLTRSAFFLTLRHRPSRRTPRPSRQLYADLR